MTKVDMLQDMVLNLDKKELGSKAEENKKIKREKQQAKKETDKPKKETRVSADVLNLMDDGIKVTVKFLDKVLNKLKGDNQETIYYKAEEGILETDFLSGYKTVAIKNARRKRHIMVANSPNFHFFVDTNDYKKHYDTLYQARDKPLKKATERLNSKKKREVRR